MKNIFAFILLAVASVFILNITPVKASGDDVGNYINVLTQNTSPEAQRVLQFINEPKQSETWLWVNLSTFRLQVWNGRSLVAEYPVIVGKHESPTATFTDYIDTISINPVWKPAPKSQAHLQKHPDIRHKYGVIGSPGSYYSPPGPKNPMGKVRFNLATNKFYIRIHGYMDLTVFDKPNLSQSSGCIRLRDPVALLSLLDSDSSEKYTDILKTYNSQNYKLPNRVYVYVTNFTIDVKDGVVVSVPNVY